MVIKWLLRFSLLSCLLLFGIKYTLAQVIDLDRLEVITLSPTKIIGEGENPIPAFYKNFDVKFDESGKIYVVDSGNDRIVILDRDGNFIKSVGRKGQGPGEFNNPMSILINNDNIFVNDQRNGRVQIFDKDFNYRDTIFPGLHLFAGFAVDNFGNLYVNSLLGTSEEDKLIKVLSSVKPYKLKRTLLNVIKHKAGEPGNQLGMNNLCLDTDENGNLYVAFRAKPLVIAFSKNGQEIYRYNFKGKIVDDLKEKAPGPSSSYKYMFRCVRSHGQDEVYLLSRAGIINIMRKKGIIAGRIIHLVNSLKEERTNIVTFSFDIIDKDLLVISDLVDYTVKIYQIPEYE